MEASLSRQGVAMMAMRCEVHKPHVFDHTVNWLVDDDNATFDVMSGEDDVVIPLQSLLGVDMQ